MMALRSLAGSPPNARTIAIDDIVAGDRIAVEAEVDGRICTFPRAVVMRVHSDVLWVALPAPDPRLPRVQPGQSLHLTFSRDGGAVIAAAIFRQVAATEPERLFTVERPRDGQAIERRRHQRLDAERPLRVLRVNSEPVVEPGAGTTVSFSAGGVLVETDMALRVGDVLTVALELDPAEVLTLPGQIVRIDDPEQQGPDSWYRVAIRFIEPSVADQERINRHIFAVQRTLREAERMVG